MKISQIKKRERAGLPRWLRGKSAGEGRRLGFHPWSRKIPHAAEKLSPRATTVESALRSLGAAAPEQRAAASEGLAPRAHALQSEKPPR